MSRRSGSELAAVALGLVLLAPAPTRAQAPRYEDAVLRHWQERYRPGLAGNFGKLVLGSLTRAERRRLGAVRLELPLRAAGRAAGNPLAFYALRGAVVLPIASVKFLDDLSLALAFAQVKGLPLQRVFDYVGMLKYRRAPRAGFPDPLRALGVPADAWKTDPRVDDIAQKTLKSAVVWVMAHETAHLLYRHPGYGGGVSAAAAQANERSADRFANEIMRRIGVVPFGMVPLFMAMAYWSPNRGDFENARAWERFLAAEATHPLTAARLRDLAADLRASAGDFATGQADRDAARRATLYVAGQIEGIARILADPGIQRLIAAQGRATAPEDLAFARPPAPVTAKPFHGRYHGAYARRLADGSVETLDLAVTLVRRGNRVNGRFSFGVGSGALRGVVTGGTLRFEWAWGSVLGDGELRLAGQRRLDGGLRLRGGASAGAWRLERD